MFVILYAGYLDVSVLAVFFLPPEVKPGIDAKCTERIGYGKVGLAIVVSM